MTRAVLETAIPAGENLLLDTSAILAYLSGSERVSAVAAILIDELVASGRNPAIVSAITVCEVLVRPNRADSATAVRIVEDFVMHFPNLADRTGHDRDRPARRTDSRAHGGTDAGRPDPGDRHGVLGQDCSRQRRRLARHRRARRPRTRGRRPGLARRPLTLGCHRSAEIRLVAGSRIDRSAATESIHDVNAAEGECGQARPRSISPAARFADRDEPAGPDAAGQDLPGPGRRQPQHVAHVRGADPHVPGGGDDRRPSRGARRYSQPGA